MNKCVFLDRDGVLNQDLDGYLYQTHLVRFPEGVREGLLQLKQAGFLLIVITNQAGISKGLYGPEEVRQVHDFLNTAYGNVLDDLYFAPEHEAFTTRSLSRKPGSLLIERAMARYRIDPRLSWMIGDQERDVTAGNKAGVKTILIKNTAVATEADLRVADFSSAVKAILEGGY